MKSLILLFTFIFSAGFLSAQCTLTGSVVDAQENPLTGASIVLLDTHKGAISGSKGEFTINDLTPGDYTLLISYLGYESQTRDITIKEGIAKYKLNFLLHEATMTLDALTVIATRAENNSPIAFQNISKATLEKKNTGVDVPFLLEWTPSLIVTSDAGTGIGYTGMRIRGTDPERINVTVNGIPLNDSESQSVYWVDLPDLAASTKDIQIQRGVGTSTNGAGAFGASVNVNTKQVAEDAGAMIDVGYGSFNSNKQSVRWNSGILDSGWSFSGRLSRINSDGYIDRASSDLKSYGFTTAYVGENNLLTFNVFSGHEVTYQAWDGVDPSLLEDDETRTTNTAGTEKVGEPYDNEVDDYVQTHFHLLYDHQLTRNWLMNLGAHYTKGAGFYEQYKAGEDFDDYGFAIIEIGGEQITSTDLIRRRWLDNDFGGLIGSFQYKPNSGKYKATIGGAFNSYFGRHFGEVIWARYASDSEIRDNYYDNDATKTDANIYAKVDYSFSSKVKVFADLQWRAVNYEFLGLNYDFERETTDVMHHFINPKVGLTYSFSPFNSVYASFAVANREPNRNDYVDNTAKGRDELSHETLYDTEAGWRKSATNYALEANLYYMLYKNQLVLNGQINDVGEYTRVNIDDSYRAGIELQASLKPLKALQLNMAVTLSQNKINYFEEYLDTYDADFNWIGQTLEVREHTDLPFSPAASGFVQVDYDFVQTDTKTIGVSLEGKYVGQQYIGLGANENNVLDPYTFANLRVNASFSNLKFAKGISLFAAVNNVLDAKYESNAWSYKYLYDGETTLAQGFYPQASKHFMAGLKLEF